MRQETVPRAAARRALLAIALLIAAAAALAAWHRRVEDREHLATGPARWIWYARAGRTPHPLRFYAFREWELKAAPRQARALVFADPEAVLWVDGVRVTDLRQKPGDPLAVIELAPYLRAGKNRVVLEASSEDGVGGLLFAVEGEGLDVRSIASGPSWRVTRDAREAEAGVGQPAIVWGRPPQSPWGYPGRPAAGR